MTWLYVLLASIVEGTTEFLPISSTGHLIILNHLLSIKTSPILTSFDIFIQLGAILAVLSLYYQELLNDKKQIFNLLASFLPTALVGLLFYPLIKSYLLDNIPITTLSLFLGGIFIFFLPTNQTPKACLSLWDYFKIGLFQSLSVIPGTSRALMSLAGGLYSGLSLVESVKYSFLLAIPTIGAATALDLFKNKNLLFQNPQNIILFISGFLLSFLTAKLTLKYFLNLVKNRDLKLFAYYRIALSVVILLVFFFPF